MNATIINEYVYPDLENFFEFELNKKKLYSWSHEEPLSRGQEFRDLFEKLLLKEEKIKNLKKRILKKSIQVNICKFSLNADIKKINISKEEYIKNLEVGIKIEFNLLVTNIQPKKKGYDGYVIDLIYENIPVTWIIEKNKISNKIKKGDYIKGVGQLSIIINDFN